MLNLSNAEEGVTLAMRGTIKYVDAERHVGYIKPDDGSPPHRFVVGDIVDLPPRFDLGSLLSRRVEFETAQEPYGPRATHIQIFPLTKRIVPHGFAEWWRRVHQSKPNHRSFRLTRGGTTLRKRKIG